MTRAFRLAGIAALFACVPVMASAQTPNPITAGISLGASLPTGELSNSLDLGFSGSIHIYRGGADPESHLKFRGNISYDKWTGKQVLASVTGRGVGGSIDGLFFFGARDRTIRPFLLGGLGLYNYKLVVKLPGTGNAQSGSTRPAVQGGGGFEFNLAGFSTMLEAKYINVFGEKSSVTWVPITFGVHF